MKVNVPADGVQGSAVSVRQVPMRRMLLASFSSVLMVATLSACRSSDASSAGEDPNALASELIDR
jgi:hypothetical protein